MRILVVGATSMEIAPFIEKKSAVDILITGVGVPETMYQLIKKLGSQPYDLVIQAGIAGSFTDSLSLASVVAVNSDAFGDLGISEENVFRSIFDHRFADPNQFPFSGGLLINDEKFIERLGIRSVAAITINLVTDNKTYTESLIRRYPAQVETMEGAAFHYCCLREKIPFLQLRSISNYVGERDKQEWKMDESIANLNDALYNVVNQFLEGKHTL